MYVGYCSDIVCKHNPTVYVLTFDGDIMASQTKLLR